MRDVKPQDPTFLMDPFAIQCQHMNQMLSGGSFLSITDGNMPGTRPTSGRMQPGAVSSYGMLGMSSGFMDMFAMMNNMMGNMEPMTTGGNCHTFLSSAVISYSTQVSPRSTRRRQRHARPQAESGRLREPYGTRTVD